MAVLHCGEQLFIIFSESCFFELGPVFPPGTVSLVWRAFQRPWAIQPNSAPAEETPAPGNKHASSLRVPLAVPLGPLPLGPGLEISVSTYSKISVQQSAKFSNKSRKIATTCF